MRVQFIVSTADCNRSKLRARRGMTLVEMLMALAIGTILMLAIGTAVSGMCNSYLGNTDHNAAVQGARLAIFKICGGVRQASNGVVLNPKTLVLKTSANSPTGYDIYTLDLNQNLRYYQDYTSALGVPTTVDTSKPSSVLTRNVASLAFAGRTDGSGFLVKVDVKMTVAPKHGSFTLSDSAVCRRNRALPRKDAPNPITDGVYVNPPPL